MIDGGISLSAIKIRTGIITASSRWPKSGIKSGTISNGRKKYPTAMPRDILPE
jgi:hypothetical protein